MQCCFAEKMENMIRIGGASSASGAGQSLQGKSSTNIGEKNVTNKEILQALRYCSDPGFKDCSGCKCFRYENCPERLEADAADLIERLTAENAKAEAERDAALADLADARSCKTCKYACDTRDCSSCKSKTCKCRECHLDKNAWEWRGLPEAPKEGGKEDA